MYLLQDTYSWGIFFAKSFLLSTSLYFYGSFDPSNILKLCMMFSFVSLVYEPKSYVIGNCDVSNAASILRSSTDRILQSKLLESIMKINCFKVQHHDTSCV